MARIREVEFPVKVYVRVEEGQPDDVAYWALRSIESKVSDSIETAINQNAKIMDKYDVKQWELLGVEASIR